MGVSVGVGVMFGRECVNNMSLPCKVGQQVGLVVRQRKQGHNQVVHGTEYVCVCMCVCLFVYVRMMYMCVSDHGDVRCALAV